jgi:hypothetical protein
MMGFDRAQAVGALSYLVIAFFLAGGVVSARYRRPLRWAALGLYGVAMALALAAVGMWLAGRGD